MFYSAGYRVAVIYVGGTGLPHDFDVYVEQVGETPKSYGFTVDDLEEYANTLPGAVREYVSGPGMPPFYPMVAAALASRRYGYKGALMYVRAPNVDTAQNREIHDYANEIYDPDGPQIFVGVK